AHQLALGLPRRRLTRRPELVQFFEIGIHGRGVQHEQPGRLLALVAERVRRTPRHQQEVSRTAGQLGVVQPEGDRAVQDEEGLRAVDVPVRRRGPRARRHGALHQREIPAGLGGDGLERHHVPPRGQQVALSRWHDVGHSAYSAWMSDLLADAVAELYSCDPDDFTQRRQELASQAREAGQPDAAKQIAVLRKPTRSAWVVNRLVRADPEVAPRLAGLAAELRGGGGGDGPRLRELTAARGRLV